MQTANLRLVGNHGPYVPPPTDYVRLPETPPRRRRIDAFFAFWIGFACGGAAVGMTVALLVGP
jgi:hypothetical protein